MSSETPTETTQETSYLDAIFAALRSAGQKLDATRTWLASAEAAGTPGWRLQALSAARNAHGEARAYVADLEARLGRLGSGPELPPPLDVLPARLDAIRTDLKATDERLLRVAADAASQPVGQA
ncbi:hypothetical protein [Chondromyces apiculatus]|uniref:Uncharacterized protein n=1 Tax=Chondromyces apiculatus DSM 436 TaxID=1192034 RepID=A0A017T3C9_9BACT|nr:hypothetical protein [Chondromyces apiculatus]EYF03492.1 Hypothetical protein CAP_5476 [Chondromyces apiculatus DSM 436]